MKEGESFATAFDRPMAATSSAPCGEIGLRFSRSRPMAHVETLIAHEQRTDFRCVAYSDRPTCFEVFPSQQMRQCAHHCAAAMRKATRQRECHQGECGIDASAPVWLWFTRFWQLSHRARRAARLHVYPIPSGRYVWSTGE